MKIYCLTKMRTPQNHGHGAMLSSQVTMPLELSKEYYERKIDADNKKNQLESARNLIGAIDIYFSIEEIDVIESRAKT